MEDDRAGGVGDVGGSAGVGVDGGRMGMTQGSMLEDRFCVDMKVSSARFSPVLFWSDAV